MGTCYPRGVRLPVLPRDPDVERRRDAAERRVRELQVDVSCEPGCAACCRHLVPLAPPEADRLVALLDRLQPGDAALVQERWEQAWRTLEAEGLAELLLDLAADPASVPPDGRAWLAQAYRQADVDCPFLINERCGIYAERPLACRLHLSTQSPAACRAGGGGGDVRLSGPPPVAAWSREAGGDWIPLVALRRPFSGYGAA